MGKTVGTRILERSIIKHIEKSPVTGVGVGKDFSILSDGCTVVAEGFSDEDYDITCFSENGESESARAGLPSLSIGEVALIRALNNLVCSGAKYSTKLIEGNEIDMSISIHTGANCPEQKLRDEMVCLTVAAEKRGIRIIGGNTVIDSDGASYSVSITVYGKITDEDKERYQEKSKQGDLIFYVGNVGAFGASMAATKNLERLKERLPLSYIKGALIDPSDLEIGDIARELIDTGAYYIHDITYGGAYRAIFEAAYRYGKGTTVIHEQFPIRQDTIEICEVLGLNPYEITGTGGFIGLCHMDQQDDIWDKLQALGVNADFVSGLTVYKEKVVLSNSNHMKRSLTYYE